MKRVLVTLLKIAISLAIIGYLGWQAQRNSAFANLRDQPKQWGLLVVAWFFCASAVLTTIIRWHYLVRAVDIPARLSSSLRIGFLGYMVNLAPLGIVGGDAVKAVMLSGEHKDAGARSVASVVVDRLIGLYMLFVVAAVAIVVTDFWRIDGPVVASICSTTVWLAGLGAVAIAILMIPAVMDGKLMRAVERLPRVGRPIGHLTEAMRMYRRRPGVLFVAALMSFAVHSFFAVGVYFIARGLPAANFHSLGSHFVMSPLAAAMGVLPLPLGPFEFMLDSLYAQVPAAGGAIPQGQGFVVALGYRIISVLVAAIGAGYYISARQEVARSIRQAGEEESTGHGPTIAMSEEYRLESAA